MRNGLSGAEVECLVEMVDWALDQRYRELRWLVPNDGTVPSNELLGVPVSRTGVDDTLHLMGRRLFKPECTLCSLDRGPDGPRIVRGPADVEDCGPDRPLVSVPAGVDRSSLLSPPV
jgi:hypothetical protein